jgi:hypothetical protein
VRQQHARYSRDMRTVDQGEDWMRLMRYVEYEWLSVHEKFVDAWTSRHPHVGNVATSCVEDTHHTLRHVLLSRSPRRARASGASW